MLKFISGIKERLAEINDGNFEVEDLETEKLKFLFGINSDLLCKILQ